MAIILTAWRDRGRYEDNLSWDASEILELALRAFAQHTFTAIVPAIILGLVFHFFTLPKQHTE